MGRLKTELTAILLLANVGFLGTAIFAYWPRWWLAVNNDASPRAWFFSVQLAAIGFASTLTFYLLGAAEPRSSKRWLWALLALAFLYLSLDKHFRLHETIREEIFIPHSIGTHLPGIRPGDIVPLIYALFGIPLCLALRTELRSRDRAWLILALFFAAIAVLLDIGNFFWLNNAALRLMQFCEKLLQTASQVCFLSFIVGKNCDLMGEMRVAS